MSGITIHKQARTTPQPRAEIRHSALQRLLVRHGVSQRKDLISMLEGETPPKKGFMDYVPGYLHIDIQILPQMPALAVLGIAMLWLASSRFQKRCPDNFGVNLCAAA